MVTFYRGHSRTLCCLPGIISLIIMCVFSHNYFYVGGRALPEPTAHSARHALLHMAPKWSSHRTTRAGQRQYIWWTILAALHAALSRALAWKFLCK